MRGAGVSGAVAGAALRCGLSRNVHMAKILLVDDSEPNRHMLARRLERRGHQVLEAVDGRQAVDMTRAESPDLVLMDLNLPVLDGWTATGHIKAIPGARPVPVIALTAHAMSGDRQKALQAGCDDYDTKPVDFPRLLGKIEALVKAPSVTLSPPRPPQPQPLPSSPVAPNGSPADGVEVLAVAVVTDDGVTAALTPATADAVTGGDGRPAVSESSGRVLVVDDTEANRALAASWLRRKGFAVDTAGDGYEALERIEGESYDAVLLDVMMPGINGIEVLRRLRQSHAPTELPVIMATAKDASRDVVEALTGGANDYVTKPLDFPVLVARVSTQVSLKRSVEQVRCLERGLEQRNRELQVANTRMQEDLLAAARIQAALLPTAGPQVEGYRFAWLFEPSAGLAGDILNVFSLDDTRVGAYVLDVSGHGVAAALLSVTVSRFLSPSPDPSSLLWHRRDDTPGAATTGATGSKATFGVETPHRVAERLSQRFPFDTVTRQYFTMVYGLLHRDRHEFTYVSAGHPQIMRVRAGGEADVLNADGFPIGVGPAEEYEDYSVPLDPGDRLYIHSDGLTEAPSPSGELLGCARMLDALRAARADPLDASLRHLSNVITEWTGTAEGTDDRTVLAIERLP